TLLTTTNIVLSSLLHDSGTERFGLLDFAPVGIPLIAVGIAYVAFFGRHSLPGESVIDRTFSPERRETNELVETYHLGQNLFRERVPTKSFLIGKRLSQNTLREDFGVSVVAIERSGTKLFAISPDTTIRDGDTLVREGDEEDFRQRDVQPYMEFLPWKEWQEQDLESRAIDVFEAMLSPRSRLIDQTLRSSHFREKYGVSVLAIWRGDQEIFTDFADLELQF